MTTDGKFNGTVKLMPNRLRRPLHWQQPRRIFVDSMSDLFHDAVPDDYIALVFAVMAIAQRHTFQVLTKRHGRLRSLLNQEAFVDSVVEQILEFNGLDEPEHLYPMELRERWWPLSNVWLGVSVENQRWADARIPALVDTPAAVRFLSCEPLLGPLDLHVRIRAQAGGMLGDVSALHHFLDWVIVGGESGPGARPMHPDWPRQIRDDCIAAGVPFFFKQWGEYVAEAPERGPAKVVVDPDGHYRRFGDALPAPGAALMWEVGKKAAGREIDGRVWSEMPVAAS